MPQPGYVAVVALAVEFDLAAVGSAAGLEFTDHVVDGLD